MNILKGFQLASSERLNERAFIWYRLLFFFSGFAIRARHISFEGVLVDICTDENRALYSGISSAFNLTEALIPIISSMLIQYAGYQPLFVFSPLLTLAAWPYST
ncbi:MAG TPA: hypothetical protein ENN84_03990, partial [Candidatus Marinimicrobia bacterium]|nr:hypothetical protein [Candidatus Neomarinimicrobiota bacterium]